MEPRRHARRTRNAVILAIVIATLAAVAVVLLHERVGTLAAIAIGPVAALLGVSIARRRHLQVAESVSGEVTQWFRSVLNTTHDFLFVFSPNGDLDYYSPSVERVIGGAELRHLEDVLAYLDPDDADICRNLFVAPEQAEGTLIATMDLGDHPTTVAIHLVDERDNDAVAGLVVFARDVTAEHDLRHELRLQALADELTGLPNRRAIDNEAKAAFARSTRRDSAMAVVLIDLDGFKGVNDTLGHPFGDKMLQEVASRLRSETRSSEAVGRIGGDEFAVVIEAASPEEALAAAQRFISVIALPYHVDDELLALGASAGVAMSTDAEDPEGMFRRADIALYESKRSGRGTVTLFRPELEELLITETRLALEMEKGIKNNEFWIAYQPLVSLDQNSIVGFEALLRWRSNALGEILPMTFIPIAERSGAIIELGEWVLRTACTQLVSWNEQQAEPLTMSVNISARQLYDEAFVGLVEQVLHDTGVDPRLLTLEITESAMVENVVAISSKLNRLRDRGVKVALDDFGTGYSSLGQLQQLPVDSIKVDRSFIANSTTSKHGEALLSAILDLGHSLDVSVVAEGVETSEELGNLGSRTAPLVQGFYFSKPVRGDEVAGLLERGALPLASELPAD